MSKAADAENATANASVGADAGATFHAGAVVGGDSQDLGEDLGAAYSVGISQNTCVFTKSSIERSYAEILAIEQNITNCCRHRNTQTDIAIVTPLFFEALTIQCRHC